jgi:hypothetical protein
MHTKEQDPALWTDFLQQHFDDVKADTENGRIDIKNGDTSATLLLASLVSHTPLFISCR